MRCAFCGSDNDEGAGFCAACGKRLDDKVRCPACHGYTKPGNFCNICGIPFGNIVRCPRCDELYEGTYCPKCGTTAPGRAGKRRRILSACVSVLGIAAILAVLVFTFFTGMTERFVPNDASSPIEATGYGINLYHFFYRAFAYIGENPYSFSGTETRAACAYAVCVLGLLISAGMMATAVGMACRCVVKVCRSLASHTSLDIRRDVALTYMLYLAFCLMLRGLLRHDINWAWNRGASVLDLNDMTIAGLAVGGALAAASFILDLVRRFLDGGEGLRPGKAVLAVLCAAILIVSAWFMTEGVNSTVYYVDGDFSVYGCGFLSFFGVVDSWSVFAWGMVAQLFVTAMILLTALSCTRMLSSAVDSGYASSRPVVDILLFIFAVAAFVAGMFTLVNVNNVRFGSSSSIKVSDVIYLIAGAAACAVGAVVSLMVGHICNRRMKGAPPYEDRDSVPTPGEA